MNFSIELPLNSTGLGNVGIGIAIELFQRGLTPNLFLIGAPDFSTANIPADFQQWLEFCHTKAARSFKRDEPSIKLWHINQSHSKLTDNTTLYTVHELDQITETERNILSHYNRVLVPSVYSKEIFESNGLPVAVCPNFYDSRVFSKVEVKREGLEDVTIFTVLGKLEHRKHTVKTIGAWCRKFGKDKRYRLHCHVSNGFLMQASNIQPKDWVAAHRHYVEQKLGFELPWNVVFYHFQSKEEFNNSLNICDIDLGLSGGEGFGLPLFTTRVLGKRGVVLRGHAHVDYCSDENSVWVEPSGKEEAYDGLFFVKGQQFNQGRIFSFEDDDAIAAMEKAVDMPPPDPKVGESLAKQFSVKNTVDILLNF